MLTNKYLYLLEFDDSFIGRSISVGNVKQVVITSKKMHIIRSVLPAMLHYMARKIIQADVDYKSGTCVKGKDKITFYENHDILMHLIGSEELKIIERE